MQLIPHLDIPPFARTAWASPAAKDEWAPKVTVAASCYHRLERETVRESLRACTTAHLDPERMHEEQRALGREGLVALPLRRVGTFSGFAHAHVPVTPGQRWNYYSVIARRAEDAEAFAAASDTGDHVALARLLGYPVCCSKFFNEVWAHGYVDPIWQAAANTRATIVVDGRDECEVCRELVPVEHIYRGRCSRCSPEAAAHMDGNHSIEVVHSLAWDALRYIGVRISPHLPCAFDCTESLRLADSWFALADRLSIPGRNELRELLALPCEWSCLKGIAWITTPAFRVVTNSVPCWPTYTVRKQAA